MLNERRGITDHGEHGVLPVLLGERIIVTVLDSVEVVGDCLPMMVVPSKLLHCVRRTMASSVGIHGVPWRTTVCAVRVHGAIDMQEEMLGHWAIG
jgi:hypothetical protein